MMINQWIYDDLCVFLTAKNPMWSGLVNGRRCLHRGYNDAEVNPDPNTPAVPVVACQAVIPLGPHRATGSHRWTIRLTRTMIAKTPLMLCFEASTTCQHA